MLSVMSACLSVSLYFRDRLTLDFGHLYVHGSLKLRVIGQGLLSVQKRMCYTSVFCSVL